MASACPPTWSASPRARPWGRCPRRRRRTRSRFPAAAGRTPCLSWPSGCAIVKATCVLAAQFAAHADAPAAQDADVVVAVQERVVAPDRMFLYSIFTPMSRTPSLSATLKSSQPSKLGQVRQPVQAPAFCGSRWYLKQSSRSSQTMQSWGAPRGMSSRILRRRPSISASPVVTFMPSATGVVQAGRRCACPRPSPGTCGRRRMAEASVVAERRDVDAGGRTRHRVWSGPPSPGGACRP